MSTAQSSAIVVLCFLCVLGASPSPPCAACIVLAVPAFELRDAPAIDIPIAAVLPIDVSDAALAGALSSIEHTRDAAFIVDARAAGNLSDEQRYRLRTIATSIRARTVRVGLELLASQLGDPAIDALAAYVDVIALPPGADPDALPARFPGIAVWTDAGSPDLPSILDAMTLPRLPGSDRVLVRLPPARRDILPALARMRTVLPADLIPDPDTRVACDVECAATAYLNPETLEAVAVVRPHAPVSRVSVAPPPAGLTIAAGDVSAEAAGAELALPRTSTPFVLQIRGRRGAGTESFATGVEVAGTRQLTAAEIVARHQVARARQERAVRTLISTGSTVLTFRVPGFAGPLTVTGRTTVFAAAGRTEIKQEDVRVNGLDLPRAPGQAPKLPLIEPERVSVPPLTIALTEAYTYALRGRERLNGHDAYVIAFSPRDAQATLYEGRAWIAADSFVLLRTDATETGLKGPIASSRDVADYRPGEQAGAAISLLQRSESFQVYVGPVESTPIHRTMTFDANEVNPADYRLRLEAAHRSDAMLLLDTPQGYQFLVPQQAGAGGEPRRPAPGSRDHVATAVAGTLFDPNISIPLPFAGISYVDFNLFGTGTQMHAFIGGSYGRLSWATRPLFRTRWRLSGDASAVAVGYNDRAFRGGIEHYDENVRQRPADASIALVGAIAPRVRLRTGYGLSYTRYTLSDSTAKDFVLPASTPVHGARLAVEMEHGAWNGTMWFTASRRQGWRPWGVAPSPAQLDTAAFERYGATLARSIVWSPRAVAHVEAAWMTGRGLDRFSQFAFGAFDNPLRGYPSVSIRYHSGAAIRSVATWTPASHVRLDGFADLGAARAAETRTSRLYPGLGGAIEVPAPFGWLVAAEWGYGIRGVNANGTIGTHVVRVTGYKMF